MSLYVTQGDILDVLEDIPAVGLSFDGLDISSEDEHRIRFACAVAGDIGGPIRVGQVRRLQVDGAILSNVTGMFDYEPDFYSIGAIVAGRIGASASIVAEQRAGTVRLIESTLPSWEGQAVFGNVDSIETFGDINANIEVRGALSSLRCAGTIRGQLRSSTAFFPSALTTEPVVGAVEGVLSLGVPFTLNPNNYALRVLSPSSGVIRARGLNGRVWIAGGLSNQNGSGLLQVDGAVFSQTINFGGAVDRFVVNGDVSGFRLICASSIGNIQVTGNLDMNVEVSGTLGRLDVGRMERETSDQGQRCSERSVIVGGGIGDIVSQGSLGVPPGTEACLNGIPLKIFTPSIDSIITGEMTGSIEGLNGSRCNVSSIVVQRDLRAAGDLSLLPVIQYYLSGVNTIDVGGSVRSVRENIEDGAPPLVIDLDLLPSTSSIRIGRRLNGEIRIANELGFSGLISVGGRLCQPLSALNQIGPYGKFSVGASQIPSLPFYSPTVSSLGGGYLAVAPYGLYESMCTPVDNSTGSDRITASSFYRGQNDNCTNNDPIKLHFYGPIQIWNPFVPAAKVELITTNGTIDVSRLVTYRINPANPRELLIEGKLDAALPPGQYRVTNSTTANQALYLIPVAGTGTPCTPAVAVSPFQYNFQLLPDCAPPYCEAETNPSQECVALPSVLCDPIDFNNDGSSFDPQDIDAFLSVFSEGPCIPSTATCNDIDFNNDGVFFDPCDTDAFNLMFQEGPCTACGQ